MAGTPRKVPVESKDVSLEGWGEIIRRQGEENRAAEAAKLAELKEQLPSEIAKVETYDAKTLLALYLQHETSGYMSAFREIHEQMAIACRAEILRRLESLKT